MRAARLATVTVLLGACAALAELAWADGREAELNTKYVDPEVQAILAGKLRQEGVQFRQTSDGTIWYPLHERERVERINKAIVRQEYSGNAVVFAKAEHARLFRDRLDAQGIRYEVKSRAQREQTSWSDADNPKVREILKEVTQIILKEHAADLQRRQGLR